MPTRNERTVPATPRPAAPGPVTPVGLLGQNSIAYLDLLRAGAANLVLVGHAVDIFGRKNVVPAGHIGISIFFLLSGFLILRSSIARIRRPGPYLLPFIIDRFARIFTAYAPVLILVAFLNSVLVLGEWGQDGVSIGPAALLGNLVMLQNYPVFQVLRDVFGPVLYIRPYNTAEPFWSIPIEFWIYVFFGTGFFGLFMRERLGVLLPVTLGVLSLPVVVWNAAAGGGNGLSLVWLVGAVAAYLWSAAWERSARKLQTGLWVVGFGLLCFLGRGLKTGWDFQETGMVLCETMVFLGGLSVMEGLPPLPVLIRAPCLFFASYSFSLYLVHNTVVIIAQRYLVEVIGRAALPAALVAAHVCAFVSYLLFERHYRQVGAWLKHGRFSPVRLAPQVRLDALGS